MADKLKQFSVTLSFDVQKTYLVEAKDEDEAYQIADKILEMVEQGILDKDTVIMSCLKYMSEDDVADMAHSNEFFINEEEYDEEDE
jgi:ABC-type proline/glycine betaine transport system ATPase subunit